MKTTTSRTALFGPYALDVHSGELRKFGRRVKMGEQTFQILFLLLERSGEVVSREELRAKLWADDTFVDFDHGLNSAIQRLRDCLADSAGKPRWVETLPRRGYRFVGQVEWSEKTIANGGTRETSLAEPSIETVPIAPIIGREEENGVGVSTVDEEKRRRAKTPVRMESDRGPRVPRATRWLVLSVAAGIALLAVAYVMFRWHVADPTGPKIKSLAVLPMKNLSGDPAQEYFADGMTEALIGRLATIRGLRVISRTTVMGFKDTRMSVPEIAKALHVDAIVEGSVIREGSRVRVHAQLIRGATDEHLWSESYDRDLQDVLTMESEISRVIANEFQIELHAPEADHRSTRPVDREAYEDYLKGLYFLHKNTQAEWQKGKEYLENAVKKDPTYAPPYSGLADFYLGYGGGDPPLFNKSESFADRVTKRAEPLARKAIALDESLSEGHVSLANIYMSQHWDWPSAEREIRRALELNPNNPNAHAAYSTYLALMGHLNEALMESEQELELNPLDAAAQTDVGNALCTVERYQEAIASYRKAIELDPTDDEPHAGLAKVYEKKGMYKESISETQLVLKLLKSHSDADFLERAYVAEGFSAAKKTLWRKQLDRTKKEWEQGHYVIVDLVGLYAQLDDKNQAFYWLDKACVDARYVMVFLKFDSEYDNLRSDPRYQAVLKRAGIPPG
jgi:TolB-like protein/DNA-binding winged helix-turn-helix (wHTH) protein/Tfp pilus assembly protein PilF